MAGTNTYKKLCSLSVYHRYHLDDGETIFTDPAVDLEKQLDSYNVHDFMQIKPFKRHESSFKGHKLFVKNTNEGFDLFVQAKKKGPNSADYVTTRNVDRNLYIGFTIRITDPLFENYSTIGAFNANPLYFTNKRPNTESASLPFIGIGSDASAASPIADFRAKTSTTEDLADLLSPEEFRGLFGVIYLRMRGANTTPNRSMLKSNGSLVNDPPQYSIHLANRNTIWNYRDAQSGNLLHSSDPVLKPLVKRGIVVYSFDGKDRPSAIPDRLLFEKDTNGNIIKTFSEIYI